MRQILINHYLIFRIRDLNWQVLAAKCILEQPDRQATPAQIANYVDDNYPGYATKFKDMGKLFRSYLPIACKEPEEKGALPPTSSNYSNWFTKDVSGGLYQLKDLPEINKALDDFKDVLARYEKKVTSEVIPSPQPLPFSSSSRLTRGSRKDYSESDSFADESD